MTNDQAARYFHISAMIGDVPATLEQLKAALAEMGGELSNEPLDIADLEQTGTALVILPADRAHELQSEGWLDFEAAGVNITAEMP